MRIKQYSLIIFMVIICIFPAIAGIPESPCSAAQPGNRYIILVIDTSSTHSFYTDWGSIHEKNIYNADSSIEYVKQASVKFIDNVLGNQSGGRNRVAVIAYDAAAELISDFTTDKNLLTQNINMLTAGSDTCDISAGLTRADSMFSSINDSNAEKIIVIVNTGFTNVGDSSYQGHYDSDITGSSWQNVQTGINLYAYANNAYSTADNIKKYATIYSLGLFQTMENMPPEGKNIADFFKIVSRDLASDHNLFYEVENPADIELRFDDIVGSINEDVPLRPEGSTPAKGKGFPWLIVILALLFLLLLLILLLFLLLKPRRKVQPAMFGDLSSGPASPASKPLFENKNASSFNMNNNPSSTSGFNNNSNSHLDDFFRK